jgi:xanthine dehydrogenase accessory factor
VAYVVNTETGDAAAGRGPRRGPTAFPRRPFGMEEDGATFVHVHNPPLRMIVVGAVHIAQALLPMARMAGYDVSLVDPRPAFAQDTRFPGETVVEDWPDEALDALAPDARTAS